MKMAQPRFRQYTDINTKPKKERKPMGPAFKRAIVVILVLVVLGAAGYYGAKTVPVNSSLDGSYSPPEDISGIENFSEARWNLHSAHEKIVTSYLAWYHVSTRSPAASTLDLDLTGYRPFLLYDQASSPVIIHDSSTNLADISEPFVLGIAPVTGTTGGYITRKTMLKGNLLGEMTEFPEELTVQINPDSETSLYAQFLPEAPQFREEYMCFLAHLWGSAFEGYVGLYHHPPRDLEDLLRGVGLIPNPDCMWPFDLETYDELDVSVECGVIDSKIVYWQVTFAGGATRGQAYYWDRYIPYDDPETPEKIITGSITSPVVDPGLVAGTRNVMFTDLIIMDMLLAVKPVEVDYEAEEE